MNDKDALTLLQLASAMYPANMIPEGRMAFAASVWASAFPEPLSTVMDAFRDATRRPAFESRMPSLPFVRAIVDARKPPDPEEEFRNAHCGKSREEWDAYMRERNDPKYAEKMQERRKELERILNRGKDAKHEQPGS